MSDTLDVTVLATFTHPDAPTLRVQLVTYHKARGVWVRVSRYRKRDDTWNPTKAVEASFAVPLAAMMREASLAVKTLKQEGVKPTDKALGGSDGEW